MNKFRKKEKSFVKFSNSKDKMETLHLMLKKLCLDDAQFIFELVNSAEWIQYIGERNVNTVQDAEDYIRKIINNPNVTYWVVYLREKLIPVGIITLIKREYLEHHDIGFAMLPDHTGKGYAAEATAEVLRAITRSKAYSKIQAITIKENSKSIRLLKKLGLVYEKDIEVEGESLLVYSMTMNYTE